MNKSKLNEIRRNQRRANRVLINARLLLEGKDGNGQGWTKHTLARSSPQSSKHLSFDAANATCFCASGAIRRAAHDLGYDLEPYIDTSVLRIAERRLTNVLGAGIAYRNDQRRTTYPQMLIAFDMAVLGAGNY